MKRTELFKGKIKYRVVTENAGVFLNNLRKSVDVLSVCMSGENTICFSCFYEDKTRAEKCMNSCGCRIVEKKNSLVVYVCNVFHRRIGLVVGFLLSVIMVYGSTFFVWDIRVKGNENLCDTEIVEMLSKAGFEKGALKRKVDVKKIANRVLINEDALSWIAINLEGTVATAEVKEAEIHKRIIQKENVNIVASNNGIIMRVDALDGESQVTMGDTVTKGQLLISSFVKKRTGGSILKGAKGFVWAKSERHFRVVVPMEYYEKKYTERNCSLTNISFLGKQIFLPKLFWTKFKNYDTRYTNIKLKISDRYVLPIEAKKCINFEYEPYLKRRTQRSALEIARKIAEESLKIASKNFRIADVHETYKVIDGNLLYECTFEGIENIAKELEFELL